ncbi:hypothetical protein H8N03_10775 [Ramlibacter sp. USB13]|uniref:Uncharacterized protein n=1 Tax=Ramlibacter cellulosilyticus TaxID=2764187 RepID=A0A923SB44_9BURK|nr:hypothetical protein [Ramlibacter cellulosilyticus]MBC5783429.1 hypothetical protein [Ramlibacter cellulosilyticus]
MPVVINEFEAVDAPPAPATPAAEGGPQQQPLPQPEDLRRLLDVLSEAQLRLWAH